MAALSVSALASAACASRTVDQVLADPSRYRDREVQLTGAVVDSYSFVNRGAYRILFGLVNAGKPLGVLIGAGLASLGGLHLPPRVGWRELFVGGLIAAMGFSVGLVFCDALLPPGQLRSECAWVCF